MDGLAGSVARSGPRRPAGHNEREMESSTVLVSDRVTTATY